MRTNSDQHTRTNLKTATAIADPVLVRLATGQGLLVLLASDVQYDRAGVMRLQQVRWTRSRAAREIFTGNRAPLAGWQNELQLRQMAGHWVGTINSQAIFRAPATRRGVAMANLTHDHYVALRTATPRRLLIAGKHVRPHRSLVAKALRTFHVVKAAVSRVAHYPLALKPA